MKRVQNDEERIKNDMKRVQEDTSECRTERKQARVQRAEEVEFTLVVAVFDRSTRAVGVGVCSLLALRAERS